MAFSCAEGVLLVAHGTVENSDDIPAFLASIRRGRPASPELIAEVRRRYERIGRSPLLDITRAQASALSDRLRVPVLVGMRLWRPTLEEALLCAADRGIRRLYLLPLAPYSVAVYEQATRASAAALLARDPSLRLELVSVGPWGSDSGYIAAHFENTAGAIVDRPDTALLLTAHSLPLRVLAAGDRYAEEVEASARALADRLQRDCQLVYQSQGAADAGPWLGPDLKTELQRLAASGCRRVTVAPIGFLADHVETLYDLDIEARAEAERLGLDWQRVPALNAHPRLIEALAALVERTRAAD